MIDDVLANDGDRVRFAAERPSGDALGDLVLLRNRLRDDAAFVLTQSGDVAVCAEPHLHAALRDLIDAVGALSDALRVLAGGRIDDGS